MQPDDLMSEDFCQRVIARKAIAMNISFVSIKEIQAPHHVSVNDDSDNKNRIYPVRHPQIATYIFCFSRLYLGLLRLAPLFHRYKRYHKREYFYA